MRRGTLLLGLFLLVAVGILAASNFLSNQPPVTITVAVDPLIREWAAAVVADFNASGSRVASGRQVVVTLTEIRDMEVWQNRRWNAQDHPQAWIAASSASVTYAAAAGLPLRTFDASLATTPIIWMAYTDRADRLTARGSSRLDWPLIQTAAEAGRWSDTNALVNLALTLPNQTMAGLGALVSGAASYHRVAELTGTQLSDAGLRAWLRPIIRNVPNYNQIGGDIGAFIARTGRSATDFAIGAESQFLTQYAAISRAAAVTFAYPEYTVVLDFPLARWDDATVTTDETQAVTNLRTFLRAPRQQTALLSYGLRPSHQALDDQTDAPLFSASAGAGIQRTPSLTTVSFPQAISEAQALIRWFEQENR